MLMMKKEKEEERMHAFFGSHIALQRPLSPQVMLRVDDLSFLRMMHHCIIAAGFQPKERPANRRQGRLHRDRLHDSSARNASLAV